MTSESPMTGHPSPEIKSACGGTLKDPSAYPSAMFHGERVYFCTKACLKAFLAEPEAFMAGEIEHPLEEDEIIESSS
ncbi:MAG TPA: hypothetical protein PKL78_02465 [Anaerolineales bacterium]|nr:hypothetical protein [Anaerolineales bacterium]HNN12393.1 hypothetical protein [Anaerolineales bacterium]